MLKCLRLTLPVTVIKTHYGHKTTTAKTIVLQLARKQ